MGKKKMKMGKKKMKKTSQQKIQCPYCKFSAKNAADVDAHVRLACGESRGKGLIALPERTGSGSAKVYVCGDCTTAEPKSFKQIADLEQHKAAKHPKQIE